MNVYDERGKLLNLGAAAGRGGEAIVYRVNGKPDWVAKIYSPAPRLNYPEKLAWMQAHPPANPTRAIGHPSLAWPAGLLYDSQRRLAGYLMPYLRFSVPVLDIFNPRRRAETLPRFDRRYLHRAARNLAAALGALHTAGYVVGDLNESNVLITPSALVTLIDTDSFQVEEQRGVRSVIHFCPVGKLEYTPPELQGRPLDQAHRQPEQDRFGLGVLIFQLLMEGSHPFRAQWLGGGDPPPIEERIAKGGFPYTSSPSGLVRPPKNAPGLELLHPNLAELMRRCFIDGHRNPALRPSPTTWEHALAEAEQALITCRRGHLFSNHLSTCPFCPTEVRNASPRPFGTWRRERVKKPAGPARNTASGRPPAGGTATTGPTAQGRASSTAGNSSARPATSRPAGGASPSRGTNRQPATGSIQVIQRLWRLYRAYQTAGAWPAGPGGASQPSGTAPPHSAPAQTSSPRPAQGQRTAGSAGSAPFSGTAGSRPAARPPSGGFGSFPGWRARPAWTGPAQASASGSWTASPSRPSGGSGSRPHHKPRPSGSTVRPRTVLIHPGMSSGLWNWARPRLVKSLAYGGGLGALAGLAPGALVGVATWSAGDVAAWSLLWALGGVAGGLLRGWQPAYRLSHWINGSIGWHRFWPLVGMVAGAGTGSLLGLLFGWWLILPVFLGLILGGWIGAAAGRKIWLAGRRVGWERIWAVGGALAAGITGFLLARWASASGLGTLADQLAGEAAFWMIDHSVGWGLVWTLIGAICGALGGAVAGLFADLLARFSGLVD